MTNCDIQDWNTPRTNTVSVEDDETEDKGANKHNQPIHLTKMKIPPTSQSTKSHLLHHHRRGHRHLLLPPHHLNIKTNTKVGETNREGSNMRETGRIIPLTQTNRRRITPTRTTMSIMLDEH